MEPTLAQDVREDRRAGQGRADADGGLVLAVAQEERIQQVAVDARVEDAVAGADHGAVVDRVGQADARREVLVAAAECCPSAASPDW